MCHMVVHIIVDVHAEPECRMIMYSWILHDNSEVMLHFSLYF